MSGEIPDRKQWAVEYFMTENWGVLSFCDSRSYARKKMKAIKAAHPSKQFRLIEQTISSKVVEG